jgi:hypothetical protein
VSFLDYEKHDDVGAVVDSLNTADPGVKTSLQQWPLRRAVAQSSRPFAVAVADAASQSYSTARNSTVQSDPIRGTNAYRAWGEPI